MPLRRATTDDEPEVIRLVLSFIQFYPRFLSMLAGATPDSVQQCIDMVRSLGDDGLVLLATDRKGKGIGVLACVVVPHPVTGQRYADELVWFVDVDKRGARESLAMLRIVTTWARERGASHLKMVAPFESKVGRFYKKTGFEPIESSYIKRLV